MFGFIGFYLLVGLIYNLVMSRKAESYRGLSVSDWIFLILVWPYLLANYLYGIYLGIREGIQEYRANSKKEEP